MSYLRSDGRSPYRYVKPTIRGFGRVGPWSTETRDRRLADAMESMLHELPLRGYGEIIRMLQRGELTLPDVWVARMEGRLDELREWATDPPLEDAVAEVRSTISDRRQQTGLDNLLRLAPEVTGKKKPRLSCLREPKQVKAILHRRESEGLKRNSVRRSMYRAISTLLSFHLGRGERTKILAEVHYPHEDDERTFVWLDPEEINHLLDSCDDPLFRLAVEFAVTSGVDRGPILRIKPRYFDEEEGTLGVLDSKTAARPRRIQLGDTAQRALRRAIQLSGASPNERVFTWSTSTFSHRWCALREEAELEWLRFKDLRAVFATYFLVAGGSPKQLKDILGHSDLKTTLRYVKRLPVDQGREMEGAAEAMKLVRHLKVEGVG